MRNKILFLFLCSCLCSTLRAQNNFSYTPEKPAPGDLITIRYIPAGDIKGSTAIPDAAVYQIGSSQKATDLQLKKKDGTLTASFKADTAASFLFFVFADGEKVDNNLNNGYRIKLYDNGQLKKGAFGQEGLFYNGNGRAAHIDKDYAKAIQSYEQEFALYPESKKQFLFNYLQIRIAVNEQEGKARAQEETDLIRKGSLLEEADYTLLESLYDLLQSEEQARWAREQKQQQFPQGRWRIFQTLNEYLDEKDPVKKRASLDNILVKIETDPAWSFQKGRKDFYKSKIAGQYAGKKDWEGFKKAMAELPIEDTAVLAALYNDVAWQIQETDSNLDYAAEISEIATAYAKAEWKKPAHKPEHYSGREWAEQCRYIYAMYADTYASILFRKKQYKKGLPYAREAALEIGKGKNEGENNTYAMLAEKALPRKAYQQQLEQLVIQGGGGKVINNILKRAYILEKGTEKGFGEYYHRLLKKGAQTVKAALRQSMLSEAAPGFALTDLQGKQVDLASLKGKVVVLDFWATWCGPCKASFPGMQKVLDRYGQNKDVCFLFIDTWESGADKRKTVADFIAKNHYAFQVLMDEDSKVVTQFKVDGIPAKFVIDKQGKIRFKTMGFDNEEQLIRELTAMIELAGE